MRTGSSFTKSCTALIAALSLVAGCKGDSKGERRVSAQRGMSLDTAMREESAPSAATNMPQDEIKAMPASPKAAHAQTVDLARSAGVLGGNADISSGFDDASVYGAGAGGGGAAGGKDFKKRDAQNGKTEAGETATRAWFPETFLFEPLVVTDEHGDATVPVRVPDRLTSWRVLALAHSRTGQQGGTVTSFAGTLPAYVEPVVPKVLVVGDTVRVPIQLVNTTSAPITATLEVRATNATLTAAGGSRTIPAEGSLVEYATLEVAHAGTVKLEVKLGGTDAVVRTIEVVPSGRAVSTTRSGTLAAPRKLTTDGIAGADAATDRVRLLAYPGALALLRSELGVSTARSGVADDAYALLLAGKATALLAALGDKADPAALRDLTILTSQRVIRDGRTLDVATASLLAEAALAHPQNPVLARLGERAVAFLQQHQRPDGTFDGGNGWTLQRLLVATADATRAAAASTETPEARQRALAIGTRASGAFERNLDRIDDPYTAAAILASGAATGPIAEKLRAKVREAIRPSPSGDGSKLLAVGEGVVRADGLAPSFAEATALAVLALSADPASAAGEDKAALADLGATLLGSYSPERGWGDGRANLVCMRAVLELFKAPVPADVKITLAMDGKPVVDGVLSRDKLRDVLVLEAPAAGLASDHTWTITAEPPVAGLGYALALKSWVPWDKEPVHGGLEMALAPAMAGTVGSPVELAVNAIAPSATPLHLQVSLPAGVQVDTPTLDALVAGSTIARYEVADGKIDLYVNGLVAGQTFGAKLRVIPTLAGTLHAPASELDGAGQEVHVPPTTWTVK